MNENNDSCKLYKLWRRETYSVPYTVRANSPEEAVSLAENCYWEDWDFDSAEFIDAGPFEVEENNNED